MLWLKDRTVFVSSSLIEMNFVFLPFHHPSPSDSLSSLALRYSTDQNKIWPCAVEGIFLHPLETVFHSVFSHLLSWFILYNRFPFNANSAACHALFPWRRVVFWNLLNLPGVSIIIVWNIRWLLRRFSVDLGAKLLWKLWSPTGQLFCFRGELLYNSK